MRTYAKADFQKAIDRSREQNGSKRVREAGRDRWTVAGNTGEYVVNRYRGEYFCSCPARGLCWHMAAAYGLAVAASSVRELAPAPAAPSVPGRFDELDEIENGPTFAERFGVSREAF